MDEYSPGHTIYGCSIGILLLNTRFPRLKGDVGNAETFSFPVMYHVVKSSTITKVIDGDPTMIQPFIEGAKILEDEGVKAVTTSCGFLALFQKQIASAVGIPVFTSSIMQVPFVSKLIGGRRIGLITSSGENLGEAHFRGAGWSSKEFPVAVSGMEKREHFSAPMIRNEPVQNYREIIKEMVDEAIIMQKKFPDIGAYVLECANMAPYSRHIQQATNLPVFDLITLVNYVHSGIAQREYQ